MEGNGLEAPLVVMVSSTVLDLPDHRKAVLEACLSQDCTPKMMEFLPAVDSDAIAASLEMVALADIYIGVFAYRYGHIPDGYDKSITEMEYEQAVQRGIKRLVFFIDEDHSVKRNQVETGLGAEKLQALKDRIGNERVAAYFKSPEDLRAHVISSLEFLLRARRDTFEVATNHEEIFKLARQRIASNTLPLSQHVKSVDVYIPRRADRIDNKGFIVDADAGQKIDDLLNTLILTLSTNDKSINLIIGSQGCGSTSMALAVVEHICRVGEASKNSDVATLPAVFDCGKLNYKIGDAFAILKQQLPIFPIDKKAPHNPLLIVLDSFDHRTLGDAMLQRYFIQELIQFQASHKERFHLIITCREDYVDSIWTGLYTAASESLRGELNCYRLGEFTRIDIEVWLKKYSHAMKLSVPLQLDALRTRHLLELCANPLMLTLTASLLSQEDTDLTRDRIIYIVDIYRNLFNHCFNRVSVAWGPISQFREFFFRLAEHFNQPGEMDNVITASDSEIASTIRDSNLLPEEGPKTDQALLSFPWKRQSSLDYLLAEKIHSLILDSQYIPSEILEFLYPTLQHRLSPGVTRMLFELATVDYCKSITKINVMTNVFQMIWNKSLSNSVCDAVNVLHPIFGWLMTVSSDERSISLNQGVPSKLRLFESPEDPARFLCLLGAGEPDGAFRFGSNWVNSDLRHANLSNLNLAGFRFRAADLSHADLTRSDLLNAIFRDAIVKSAGMSQSRLAGVDATEADFTSSDLNAADLSYGNWKGVRFDSCNLRGATFRNANLCEATFDAADLQYVDFRGAIFERTSFYKAKVRQARFDEGLMEDKVDLSVADGRIAKGSE